MKEQERILMQEEEQRERIRLEEEQKQMELKRIQEEEKKQTEERQAKMIGNSSNYFDSLLFKNHYSK